VSGRTRLFVIGNGMAGARLVQEIALRGGGLRLEMHVFGDEPYGNYDRTLLSGVLSGSHDPRDIFLNSLAWYEDNGVTLHAGARVVSVDRAAREVITSAGARFAYDQLVFATGSSPLIPAIIGATTTSGGKLGAGVFVFRSLDDCDAIVKYAARSRVACIIGGGLLGLEAARGLAERGLEVHVVHLADHLMDVELDPCAGALLAQALRATGVKIHLGAEAKEIARELGEDGGPTAVRLVDGQSIACDLVVLAAGVRPNVDLARDAGLTIKSGIVVNDDLSCAGAPELFALGECAEHRGKTYHFVAPLWDQAEVLANRLAGIGKPSDYEGSKLSTKLRANGLELVVMGEKAAAGDGDEELSYVEAKRGIYKKAILRDGKLVGAIVFGDPALAPRLLQTFHRGAAVPDDRASLFFAGSALPLPSAAELGDDARICACNGISKGDLVRSIQAGNRTLRTLCSATRAGVGCGSCKGDVQSVLEATCGGPGFDPAAHYYVPGVPLSKPDLVREIRARDLRSVSRVFEVLAGGREDAASKMGLASLLKTIWGNEYEEERDARSLNDRVFANIQKDGTFSVVPRIYGGVTSPAELRRIADVAERHDIKMLKITGGQRIDMLGVPKNKLADVWRDLGMPSGHAYTKGFRTCKTCVGSEFCRYGEGDSTALGVAIERRFQGLEAPHKIKMATAGCGRNCSEATTKDLGAVAREDGLWEIYVGGAAGTRVRKGDVLCVVSSHDDVLQMMGRFMQYYRENAKYLERTYAFVERIGIDQVRRVVVDDAEGIAAELDARLEAAMADYVDPWLDTPLPEPVTPPPSRPVLRVVGQKQR
jgi:nitrite reductase (NADH) large subunit